MFGSLYHGEHGWRTPKLAHIPKSHRLQRVLNRLCRDGVVKGEKAKRILRWINSFHHSTSNAVLGNAQYFEFPVLVRGKYQSFFVNCGNKEAGALAFVEAFHEYADRGKGEFCDVEKKITYSQSRTKNRAALKEAKRDLVEINNIVKRLKEELENVKQKNDKQNSRITC